MWLFVFVCASMFYNFIKGQYSVELPWYFELNGQRERTFVRHPLNNRIQNETRRRYVALIKRHGIKKGKRSQPIAVPNHAVPGQYFLLAGATLAEAFYEAPSVHRIILLLLLLLLLLLFCCCCCCCCLFILCCCCVRI